MGYASTRGRKPFERASKISHAEIINNEKVQAYLNGCAIPQAADAATLADRVVAVPPPVDSKIRVVVAIDGGFTETPVRREFPSASIAFFTFGPLLFKLEDLEALDRLAFIAPEDLAKLKHIQRYSLVLPTKNVTRRGKSLQRTIRETLQEFFLETTHGDAPLVEALRWLLFRGWETGGGKVWELPRCPNPGCDQGKIELTPASPNEQTCAHCGGPVFMIDALRLHERIDEDQGASGIQAYVMTVVEHVALVHVIKTLWELKPQTLSEILIIKDGPLAFFGQVAPLSQPMRELALFLATRPTPSAHDGATSSLLNVVGLEKSGPFVEHAIQIEDRLEPNTALLLGTDYIYRYIVPGDPMSQDPYGKNTYWGGKLIYKASDHSLYVATIPTGGFNPMPGFSDFPNLAQILSVVGKLRCSM